MNSKDSWVNLSCLLSSKTALAHICRLWFLNTYDKKNMIESLYSKDTLSVEVSSLD